MMYTAAANANGQRNGATADDSIIADAISAMVLLERSATPF